MKLQLLRILNLSLCAILLMLTGCGRSNRRAGWSDCADKYIDTCLQRYAYSEKLRSLFATASDTLSAWQQRGLEYVTKFPEDSATVFLDSLVFIDSDTSHVLFFFFCVYNNNTFVQHSSNAFTAERVGGQWLFCKNAYSLGIWKEHLPTDRAEHIDAIRRFQTLDLMEFGMLGNCSTTVATVDSALRWDGLWFTRSRWEMHNQYLKRRRIREV